MKKYFFITIIVLITNYLIAQTNSEQATTYYQQAILLMDEGSANEAITLLDEAISLDVDNETLYSYEKAYAYSILENYEEAIKILKSIQKNDDAFDLIYSLLGNCYDWSGDAEKAIKTYNEGLEEFPNSGKLYLELGVMDLINADYDAALLNFEEGIYVEPSHPSNYYWAARIYLLSEDIVWGLIYGEIFMNMEYNTERSITMSQLLYDAYFIKIIIDNEDITVNFTDKSIIDQTFANSVYEPAIETAALGETEINYESINRIRTKFINNYYEKNLNEKYPNLLFDWNKELIEAGLFEAYNYWLMMRGDYETFAEWMETNEPKLDEFAEWCGNNPLTLDETNYVHSTLY